ncbi:MAG: hypothetical protein IIW80_00850, partial [Treponema sp.]|nr:hypothetical protein [Treponema sp.]
PLGLVLAQSGVRWLANYISFCFFPAFANVIFAMPQAARTIPGTKRRLKVGELHITLLLSCVCVCNFHFALSRRTLFLCKAVCGGWQITYHFATFLRLRI